MILNLYGICIFFSFGAVAVVVLILFHIAQICYMSQTASAAFKMKISFVRLKGTAGIVRLTYLLDCIDSGLTARENLSYCLGKEGRRIPMSFYDF